MFLLTGVRLYNSLMSLPLRYLITIRHSASSRVDGKFHCRYCNLLNQQTADFLKDFSPSFQDMTQLTCVLQIVLLLASLQSVPTFDAGTYDKPVSDIYCCRPSMHRLVPLGCASPVVVTEATSLQANISIIPTFKNLCTARKSVLRPVKTVHILHVCDVAAYIVGRR